ncbi:MAG: energy transducer TonB [Steroidobacteraceae bacterium]|jgi:protein TonB
MAAILALHALGIRVLWSGPAGSGVRLAAAPIQIQDLRPARPPDPLPLPPVSLQHPSLLTIEAPEVEIPETAEAPAPAAVVRDPPPRPVPIPAPAAVEPEAVVDIGPLPTYVPRSPDRYPADSIRAGEIGAPTILICISAAGAVDSVRLAKSSGFARLDQAALGIGRDARFRPATRRGKPVALCRPYRIKFGIGSG